MQANGTCKACDKPAADSSFPCCSCEKVWHVRECTAGTDLVTLTCLNNMLKPWKVNGTYPCVCFVCPPCIDAKNLQRDIVVSNRMSVVEESVNDMKQDIQIIKDHVMGQGRQPDTDFPPLPGQSKPSDSVIVVKKPADAQYADKVKIKEAVISSRAPVSSSYVNKGGDTVIILQDAAAKDRLAANLRETIGERDISTPATRSPTIRVTGMDENLTTQAIFTSAKELNAERGIEINDTNFKVLFVRPHAKNAEKFQATIRVSNELRAMIQHREDKIYVGMNFCPVYDHFHVKRCNLCQGYNHYKEGCTKAAVCGKCAGAHQTDTCAATNFKCVHCVANEHDHDHTTSDLKCKSYKAAQNKLEKSIGFYKKKN